MAWGSGFAGGSSSTTSAAAGLPFAGIPSELGEGVRAIEQTEPDHGELGIAFRQRAGEAEQRRLSLWHLAMMQPSLLLASGALIVVSAVVAQAGPKLTEVAIDDGMLPRHGDIAVIGLAAGLYLGSVLVTALSQRALVMTTGRFAAWIMRELRIRVFTHLQRLSLDFFTAEKGGVIMTRMTSDIENLQQLLQNGLAQFAIQALTMIVITILLFTMNVRLTIITLAIVVPALTILSLWFRSRSILGYQRVRDRIADVLADVSESLHGVRVVTAYNRQRRNVIHHRNVLGDYRHANVYTAQINAVYGPGTQVLGYLGQAAILGIGGEMVLHGSLQVGALVAFFLYLNRFFQPIQLLVQQYNSYQQGQSSIVKLRTLLETAPTVDEEPDAVELPPIDGEIVFEHVSFGYDTDTPVLHDVSFRIAPGETIAFVGATGAGKSTMAKLVTRFYDPTVGRVLIDGYDLRHVTLRSLRSQLGVVPQEPFLFAGTIADNVAFARPGTERSEIRAAIDAVGLAGAVDRLEGGLDAAVQERGQSLASGERQLIALARAFLARPRVLVLDEATSNLDLQSEAQIEAALDVVRQSRTAVLIAHRLSTAMRADRILVVADGRITESGTHDELVAAGGLYAAMYETWNRQSRRAASG